MGRTLDEALRHAMEAAGEWAQAVSLPRPRLLEALRDDRRVKAALADGAVRQSCRSRAANPVRGEYKLHAAGDAGPGLARHFCSPGCCPGAGGCEEVPAESILPAGFDVKDIDSHSVRALLASRALLVKIKRDLENHVRGLLKNLGLVIGRAKFNVFAVRAEELIEGRPELIAAIRPLLEARNAVEQQVSELDRKVMKLARHDAQVRQFMTVPGVGPITALAFKATIDDPARFARSRSVGAYVGLTCRRHASGEVDWSGRISKCGDAMLRSYLFEAAGVLLTRVPKWSAVKAWGVKLVKRNGLRKAKVAVARKLAVILHRMWIDGTEFNWSKKEIAA